MKNLENNCSVKRLMTYTILTLFIYSCSPTSNKCENQTSGKAILVAYRVYKHSHMWFQNPETKQIYDINALGGRREPTISLGDTINVYYCDNQIIFNKYDYVKIPANRSIRFIYLNGFSHLH